MIVSSNAALNRFQTSDLHNRMWMTFQRWYLDVRNCDVVIHCSDGGSIRAHKQVLASVSSYFENVLYGPLCTVQNINNENNELVANLNFTSPFLDCVYQLQSIDSFDLNLIEFASLCDFVDVPELFREGLRVAAGFLTPDNCVSELNKTVSAETTPVQKWAGVISRYMTHLVNFDDKNAFEGLALQDMTSHAMVSLLSTLPLAVHTLPFCYQLFCRLCRLNANEHKGEITDFLAQYIQELKDSSYLKNSQGLDLLQMRINEIQSCTDDLVESGFHIDTTPVQDDVIMSIKYHHPGMSVNFIYYPKLGKLSTDRKNPNITFFEHSLCTLRSTAKFFVWRDSLCAVLLETMIKQVVVMQYRWYSGVWEAIFNVHMDEILKTRGLDLYHITQCAIIKDNFLVLSVYRNMPDKEAETMLCLFDLPKKELVVHIHMGNCLPLYMLSEKETLFLFKHPYSIMKVDFTPEQTFKEVGKPLKRGSINFRIVQLRGKMFHVFSYKGEQGISVEMLNTETMKWENTSKVCDKYVLYDAFAANNDLFIVYGQTDPDFFVSQDDPITGIEQQVENYVVLAKCLCDELETGEFKFTLTESWRHVQVDGGQIYEGSSSNLIVSRSVFPLDDLV